MTYLTEIKTQYVAHVYVRTCEHVHTLHARTVVFMYSTVSLSSELPYLDQLCGNVNALRVTNHAENLE